MVRLCFIFQEWQQLCLNLHVFFFGDVGQIQSSVKDSDPEVGNCCASLQNADFFMSITKFVCGGTGTRMKNMSV
jgi:hypothetical protein